MPEKKIRLKIYQNPTVKNACSLKKGRKNMRISKIFQIKNVALDIIPESILLSPFQLICYLP